MDAIYLSGESIRNKAWIYEIQEKLDPLFNKTIIQVYDHWKSGGPDINLNTELANLVKNTQNIDEYIVFAKSIGTVLTAEAISKNIVNPKKCIFLGVPINVIAEYKYPFAEYLKSIKCPALFIQNRDDPTGKYNHLIAFIDNLQLPNLQYKVIELPGDTHDYTDYSKLFELTKQFILQ